MKNQKLWFAVAKLNGVSRMLIFPAFLIGGILTFGSRLVEATVQYFEMPVIVVYCNERDFPEGREKALANRNVVMARCYEKVTWQGDESEAINGLAYTKGESIVNSILATPQNPDIVREAIAKNMEYFERESIAMMDYKKLANEAVNRSASFSSTFEVRDSYVRLIEKDNPDENRWVVKLSGIWVLQDGKQKGRDATVMLSFKSPRKKEREKSQQALIVTKMEVAID